MRRVLLILLLFFLPYSILAAEPVIITSMRVMPAANQTIMTFDLTAKTSGSVKYVPSERKLILVFENARIKFSVRNAKLRGSNVASFSAVERADNSVEFNFMTTGDVDWKTNYEPLENSSGIRMRLEINSLTRNKPSLRPVKVAAVNHIQHDMLRELAVMQQQLSSRKISQQEVTGRARWESAAPAVTQNKAGNFTVVIDAGHGGKDTGALGKNGVREKDVVLIIAKKLQQKLEQLPNVRVVMTRKGDYYLPLRTRLEVARRADADLFIAVHADAYFNRDATGASVYALSQHGATSEASRWLARQENYSELDGIDFGSLPDNSRMVRSVLIDLAQTATIRDSLRLGNKVLDALDRVTTLHHKQVEQAPFVVLKSPDIPSILIETGFITNPREESQLLNPRYQDLLAESVAHGVKSYMRKYSNQPR